MAEALEVEQFGYGLPAREIPPEIHYLRFQRGSPPRCAGTIGKGIEIGVARNAAMTLIPKPSDGKGDGMPLPIAPIEKRLPTSLTCPHEPHAEQNVTSRARHPQDNNFTAASPNFTAASPNFTAVSRFMCVRAPCNLRNV